LLTNLRSLTQSGWYQDALDEARLTTSEAVILTGGIKAWVASFGEGDDAVVRL
jgi:arsenical-resistance protein 2